MRGGIGRREMHWIATSDEFQGKCGGNGCFADTPFTHRHDDAATGRRQTVDQSFDSLKIGRL